MNNLITKTIFPNAVKHNLQQLRNIIGNKKKFFPVVKADCYGHYQKILLDTIAEYADGLCVTMPNSAIHLRRLGYDGPILCFFFPYVPEDKKQKTVAELISADVTITVTSEEEAEFINNTATVLMVKADVHLKIDTGMMRTGVTLSDANSLIDFINNCNDLNLSGIYTHFSSADECDLSITIQQLNLFNDLISRSNLSDNVILHAANSSATIRLPDSHLDLVRPGLAVYGYHGCEETKEIVNLKPAMRLTAPLIQIKNVAKGCGCGYGMTYCFERDSIIGRVPIGYGDGYPRSLSNKGFVRINNHIAPVRGRVSMGQIIIDLTDIPNVKVGDEVEIISTDSSSPNSVENLASLANTIPYEITCNLQRARADIEVVN